MSIAAPPFAQPRIEPSLKHVRVLFGGKYTVDTKQAKLVYASHQVLAVVRSMT